MTMPITTPLSSSQGHPVTKTMPLVIYHPQIQALNAMGASEWSDLSPPLLTATAPPEAPVPPRVTENVTPVSMEVGFDGIRRFSRREAGAARPSQ
jgi:hypothetical protein